MLVASKKVTSRNSRFWKKKLIRSAKRPSSVCRHSTDSKRSCWWLMKTTARGKRRWALWISRFKIRSRRLRGGLAAWSASRKSRSRPQMRRKTQMSLKCKRTSWLRSSGLLTWKPKWRRKWSRISSTRTLSKKFVRRQVTQTCRRSFRNSWPVSQPMRSFWCRSPIKKRKSICWGMTMSCGARNCMNFKFRTVTKTLKPKNQARFHPNLTLWTKKRLNCGKHAIRQKLSQARFSSWTTKCRVGAQGWFKSWTSNLMRILARTLTSPWHSNLKKLCRLSVGNSSRSSRRRMMRTVVSSQRRISWTTSLLKNSLARTSVCGLTQGWLAAATTMRRRLRVAATMACRGWARRMLKMRRSLTKRWSLSWRRRGSWRRRKWRSSRREKRWKRSFWKRRRAATEERERFRDRVKDF